ncbi:hypothetical protein PR202_ga21513 [Eleusine coracana subsp. coracana]|uniref:KIB1-4 beta-propeller domain-containing protein n=1 Tax=Eleusine coracana subsp. coracana TaxID=191504 RepID=A0AAV5CZV0_ELECO|nr:hypothetical protein PR202_ga21513 [Eleusine coracana subsp. coracana]
MGVSARGFSWPYRAAGAGRRRAGLRPFPRRVPPLAAQHARPARSEHHRPTLLPAAVDDAARGPRPLSGSHQGTKLRGFVRFFNISTGAFVRVRLPLFEDHCVLDSIDGILLLQRDHDPAVQLLHPFTGDIADFPPLLTLRPYVTLVDKSLWWMLRSICAASISVSADELVTVMMLLPTTTHAVFAVSGDQQWRLSSWSIIRQLFRPLAFQGKLYCFRQSSTHSGPEVLEIHPPRREGTDLLVLPPKLIAKCPGRFSTLWYRLVECNSEILVVISDYAMMDTKFLVYRLADLILERIVPLTSIGGNSLFVGWNSLHNWLLYHGVAAWFFLPLHLYLCNMEEVVLRAVAVTYQLWG